MGKNKTAEEIMSEEHILVCISASPTNARIIRTAAKMAQAFRCGFTAIFVRTPSYIKMSEKDKGRLEYHMRLAKKLGANITTVYGSDISYQIAEFARLSKVTQIVIGRSAAGRSHFWNKPSLTEQLAATAPDIDIHIIPDSDYLSRHGRPYLSKKILLPTAKDIFVSIILLIATTFVGFLFQKANIDQENIITVYILGVLLTSLVTKSYICWILNSLINVFLFNFLFTEPRMSFTEYDAGYTVTFIVMLIASLITGTLASKLKEHAKLSAQSAFRTKILFETNQLLQKATDDEGVISITAKQLIKLLDRDIIVYRESGGKIISREIFAAHYPSENSDMLSDYENEAAKWVFDNKRRAGCGTDVYKNSCCLYLAIRINNKVFGVVGIYLKNSSLDEFESSILLSILGECALAVENIRNAKEKEREAVRAKNEQLRADLLRAISHDLRTPLTAISGNAAYLLTCYDKLDSQMRTQIFTDIYNDSLWLINLVENLLSITRLEEGRMKLNVSCELVEEVADEAIKHAVRQNDTHRIIKKIDDELLLAKMDARLIVQVIINLLDNALKYTPDGSEIVLSAQKSGKLVYISVSDNGNGIPDRIKPQVFEMFYCGENKVSDSRRSLGLGLALCKAIVNLHGGEITVEDNVPSGAVFKFCLPAGEVKISE